MINFTVNNSEYELRKQYSHTKPHQEIIESRFDAQQHLQTQQVIYYL